MLTEDKREQLDGIVQQMVSNKEPDTNIQLVVDDFKQKYSQQQIPEAPVKNDLLNNPITRGIQKIFPGQKVGQAIGTLGGFLASPNKAQYDLSAPTPLQTIGDVAKGASLVGSLALPNPTTILGTAGQYAGLSALGTAGEDLTNQNSLKQTATDSFKSGLTGALTGAVIGGINKSLTKFVEKSPEAITNSALKIENRLKIAGKSPAKDLVNEGVWGGLGSIKKQAGDGMNLLESKITDKVLSTPGGTTYGEIRNGAMSSLKKGLGELYSDKELQKIVDKVPLNNLKQKGIISWDSLNKTRKQLGTLLSDAQWINSSPSENVKAVKAVYGNIAELLQKATKTETEFSKLAMWVKTNKAVNRAIGLADSKYGLGLLDTISGTGGAVVGFGQGETPEERIKNALKYGIGAIAVEKGLRSPAFQTGVAQTIKNAGQIKSLSPLIRAGVTKTIGNINSGSSSTLPLQSFPQGQGQPISPSLQQNVSSPNDTTLSPEVQRLLNLK